MNELFATKEAAQESIKAMGAIEFDGAIQTLGTNRTKVAAGTAKVGDKVAEVFAVHEGATRRSRGLLVGYSVRAKGEVKSFGKKWFEEGVEVQYAYYEAV